MTGTRKRTTSAQKQHVSKQAGGRVRPNRRNVEVQGRQRKHKAKHKGN